MESNAKQLLIKATSGFIDSLSMYQHLYHANILSLVRYAESAEDDTRVGGSPGYRPQEVVRAELQKECQNLNALFVVSYWALLEALFEDLAVSILLNSPTIASDTDLAKVKISLIDFQQLDERQRMVMVVQEARNKLSPPRFGVDEFENIFSVLGLGGELDAQLRRDLNELCASRNVILHKGARIDLRFTRLCPWSKWKVGEYLTVNAADFDRFFQAVTDYVGVLISRLGKQLAASATAGSTGQNER